MFNSNKRTYIMSSMTTSDHLYCSTTSLPSYFQYYSTTKGSSLYSQQAMGFFLANILCSFHAQHGNNKDPRRDDLDWRCALTACQCPASKEKEKKQVINFAVSNLPSSLTKSHILIKIIERVAIFY